MLEIFYVPENVRVSHFFYVLEIFYVPENVRVSHFFYVLEIFYVPENVRVSQIFYVPENVRVSDTGIWLIRVSSLYWESRLLDPCWSHCVLCSHCQVCSIVKDAALFLPSTTVEIPISSSVRFKWQNSHLCTVIRSLTCASCNIAYAHMPSGEWVQGSM